jgi:hypothetical protein
LPAAKRFGSSADVPRTLNFEYELKLYEPLDDTGTHCTEYQPVSGEAPRQDTETRSQASESITVNTGAMGAVVRGGVVEVVAATLRPTHTRSPARKNDSAFALFRRYSSGSPNLKRTASRDQESFGNATWNLPHDLMGCQESLADADDTSATHTTNEATKARTDRDVPNPIPFVR